MSDATQPPADVRGTILRASILPFEDEETLIAGLRAGAEAVERGELDAEDFAGVWSQYLRELLRASSVPAPADVRERVAKTVYLWEATRFGAAEAWALRSWEQESNTRRELYFNVADRILAILRTPRGDVDAKALAALIVHIWTRCKNEGPHYRETDEFWADFERAYQLALLRTPRGEGEAMDADAMWYHWSSGHEDAALQGLRTATDDEAHRFLSMLADWQRCPKPSDHDAIATRRPEAQGEG